MITRWSFGNHRFEASVEDIIAIFGKPHWENNTGMGYTNFEWVS